MAEPAGGGELRALTSMRGIAAWFVVFYHIRLSIGLPPAAITVFGKGYLAVDFFFLLSGFVIWLSWGARFRDNGLREARSFLKKRIARIWPLHIVMLGAGVALALLFVVTGRAEPEQYPFDALPLHILLLQNWGLTDRLAWNDPSWSISCELGAYLVFPLLAVAIDWRGLPSIVVIAAIAMLCVLLHVAMAQAGAERLGTDIARFGLLRCLVEFTVGSAICALWLRWRSRPIVATLIALMVGAALIGGVAGEALPETSGVPPAFAALLLALALTSGRRWNLLEVAPLQYLGEISYATYLCHFLLYVVFKLALVDDIGVVPPILVVLYLAMVLGCSIALYHLVERPAQQWINRLDPQPLTRLKERRAERSALPAHFPVHGNEDHLS